MYCRDIGKRLCTRQEWELACSGEEDLQFPYGNNYIAEKCNTASNEAGASGSRAGCKSFNGVYDLVGNLWEWIEDRERGYNQIAGGNFDYRDADCRTRFPNHLTKKSQDVGFRCCQ